MQSPEPFFIVKEILKLNEMSLHVLFNITENRLGLILLHFERKLPWNDKSDKLTIIIKIFILKKLSGYRQENTILVFQRKDKNKVMT